MGCMLIDYKWNVQHWRSLNGNAIIFSYHIILWQSLLFSLLFFFFLSVILSFFFQHGENAKMWMYDQNRPTSSFVYNRSDSVWVLWGVLFACGLIYIYWEVLKLLFWEVFGITIFLFLMNSTLLVFISYWIIFWFRR